MLPIRDNNPTERFPFVTLLIIAVTTLVFFYQIKLGSGVRELFFEAGLVPSRVSYEHGIPTKLSWLRNIPSLFTYMFLHGGWMHFLGNMWMLWIFGDNVEDRFGHRRFLLFYVIAGVSSGIVHWVTNVHSTMPTIGASGAIAGVMGAYMLLFPRARVLTVVPIFIFLHFMEIPAFIFLGFWFLMQLFMGAIAGGGGIAWWAHIGGFLTGIYLVRMFVKYPAAKRQRR